MRLGIVLFHIIRITTIIEVHFPIHLHRQKKKLSILYKYTINLVYT